MDASAREICGECGHHISDHRKRPTALAGPCRHLIGDHEHPWWQHPCACVAFISISEYAAQRELVAAKTGE